MSEDIDKKRTELFKALNSLNKQQVDAIYGLVGLESEEMTQIRAFAKALKAERKKGKLLKKQMVQDLRAVAKLAVDLATAIEEVYASEGVGK